MADYQQLSKYAGSLYGRPRYEGIEYDWEVPDNLVVGSPGGVSTIHHHYTKGFDGRGNTSSDIYGGQGERYNSGVYGNLYQTGQTAPQFMGYYPAAPDYQFWQNQEPQQYSYSHSESAMWAPSMTAFGTQSGEYQTDPNTQKKAHIGEIEKFEPALPNSDLSSFELIPQADTSSESQQNIVIMPKIAPWLLFLFLIFAFIVFDFWAEAGHLFIRQKLHGGSRISWKQALMYAIIVTVIFGFILWMTGIPLTVVEES